MGRNGNHTNPDATRYLCYVDETGDHSLKKVDPDFPVFVLTAVVTPLEQYIKHSVPQILEFKTKYFPNEGVILHSRDIRKSIGSFSILRDVNIKRRFMEDLSGLIENLNFELIVCSIDKTRMIEKYGPQALNPYEYSLKVVLERLVYIIEHRGVNTINFIFEARGKKEDHNLELEFLRIMDRGTEYISHERFAECDFTISFLKKELNIIGNQIADLAGYPIARNLISPSHSSKAFGVVQGKFLNNSPEYNFVTLPK